MQKETNKNFRKESSKKRIIVLAVLLAVLFISALIFLAQTKNIFWKHKNANENNAVSKYVLSGLVIGDKLIVENLKGGAKGNE
ncbi:MAG: hypothetical protein V1886_03300 [archaeon]